MNEAFVRWPSSRRFQSDRTASKKHAGVRPHLFPFWLHGDCCPWERCTESAWSQSQPAAPWVSTSTPNRTCTHTDMNTHTQRDCCVMKFKGGWSARLRLCEEALNLHWSTEGIYFVVYSHNTCPTPSPALLTSLCAPSMGWLRRQKGDSRKLHPVGAHISDQSFSFKTKKKIKNVFLLAKRRKNSDRSCVTRIFFCSCQHDCSLLSRQLVQNVFVLFKINGFQQENLCCFFLFFKKRQIYSLFSSKNNYNY